MSRFSATLPARKFQLTSAASGLVSSNHTSATYETLFPATRFETVGVPGKKLGVACEIDQTNENRHLLENERDRHPGQRSNTLHRSRAATLCSVIWTFSPSIASPLSDAQYLIYDNVRVENWNVAPCTSRRSSARSRRQALVIYTGGAAAFSVSPGGSSPFTYQWSFNGTNLAKEPPIIRIHSRRLNQRTPGVTAWWQATSSVQSRARRN